MEMLPGTRTEDVAEMARIFMTVIPHARALGMELVEATGGFTIPELARKLKVSPSSLYNHVAGREQIVELLRGLQRKYGLAFLFISHDLRVVRAMSHQIMVMRAGDVVEQGTTEQVFANPASSYTRELMAAAFPIAVEEGAASEGAAGARP